MYHIVDQKPWGCLQGDGGVVTMCATARNAIQRETERRAREDKATKIRSICGALGLPDGVAEKAITIHLEVRL